MKNKKTRPPFMGRHNRAALAAIKEKNSAAKGGRGQKNLGYNLK